MRHLFLKPILTVLVATPLHASRIGVLSLCLALGVPAGEAFAEPPKRLVIVGDSLTEGFGVSRDLAYPSLLQNKIDAAKKPWRVINAGVSGSTSASAASRIAWQLKQKPHLIVLALGANDGLRGLKPEALQSNLVTAIQACQKAAVPVLLVGMKMPPNYGAAYTRAFEEAFQKAARQTGVPFIPFLLENVAGKPDLNLPDGIHPNEKGHALMAEHIFRELEKFL